jgi:hypothetical protein
MSVDGGEGAQSGKGRQKQVPEWRTASRPGNGYAKNKTTQQQQQ